MLYHGIDLHKHSVVIGTVDEVRSSDNQRIQNLLNRRFEEEELDPDEYLARLTGEASQGP